ncbi:hypothetical protein BKA70DRAFT_1265623 [Coprinopsis sp. MPI-PUGE-AT-0042]|nr:hypothetical protein BKA70DRAFT_1265623 [Coprinopsis sp. MPI-PUGE-AT-0042]
MTAVELRSILLIIAICPACVLHVRFLTRIGSLRRINNHLNTATIGIQLDKYLVYGGNLNANSEAKGEERSVLSVHEDHLRKRLSRVASQK